MLRPNLLQRYSLILGFFVYGWHALRLCEGRGSTALRHALRSASERATPKLSCNAALPYQPAVHPRAATTTMEMIVAIALLAAATALVGGFVHQVQKGLRDRELSARCDWELTNARERIGSWAEDRLTLDQIQEIAISDSLMARVNKAHLTASIQKIEKPSPATQITLALECDLNGQTIQPSVLTFWVPSSVEASP